MRTALTLASSASRRIVVSRPVLSSCKLTGVSACFVIRGSSTRLMPCCRARSRTAFFNGMSSRSTLMRQRTSVDLEDIPLKKAVRDLARQHGINLVIDPRIAKQADTPVSLQLDNTGLETTIRLLAELANVKAVRMGNVMFVTSEERAKKIREEEAHQFDNPLNPNLPWFGAAGVGGGFGGFGG